jgi:hypothetical protein
MVPSDIGAVRMSSPGRCSRAAARSALDEVMGVPAWKHTRPGSWSPTAIRPSRPMRSASSPRMGATTVEVPTNHVAMVSRPEDVVRLIKTAAQAVQGRELSP